MDQTQTMPTTFSHPISSSRTCQSKTQRNPKTRRLTSVAPEGADGTPTIIMSESAASIGRAIAIGISTLTARLVKDDTPPTTQEHGFRDQGA